MTVANPNLLRARALMLEHLDMHPGRTVDADLDPAEAGIVGDAAHADGGDSYHLGADQIRRSGHRYSVDESARDQRGLDEHATADDVGEFRVTTAKGTFTLIDYNRWLVALCRAGDPDTVDIREVIYTLDGRTVRRFDRLGRRSSGDDSHRWHTHRSWFRDSDCAGAVRLATRWLIHTGLLPGEDDIVTTADDIWAVKAREYVDEDGDRVRDDRTMKDYLVATHRAAVRAAQAAAEQKLRDEAILAAVKGASSAEILARIGALAEAEAARAAAEQQRDAELRDLVEQARSGQLDATEVVRLIGERLTTAAAPPAG